MRSGSVRKRQRAVERSRRERFARLGALIAAGTAAGTAQAATITVNSLADVATTNGQCTLREALNNANANADTTGGDCTAGSGTDTIQFQAGLTGTITLGGTQLSVTDSVTINGPGAGVLTVSGNNASRIFYIYNNAQALAVTISGFTLTQGNNANGSAVSDKGESLTLSALTASGNTGDAVRVISAGSLTLQSSTVTGTVAGRGIHGDHFVSANISGSTISNNSVPTGKGAGLFFYQSTGTIAIDNSIVSGNAAGNRGGGMMLYQVHGPVTISNSQITGNSAGSRGGGLSFYKTFDNVTIQNTTISGNTANNRGGGIFFYKQGSGTTLNISGSTISGNSTIGAFYGGGIFFYKQAGTSIIENTTISGNAALRGGGIHDEVSTGALIIRNSTINGNTATVDAGNLKLTSFPSVTIVNSIVANGTASANPDLSTGLSNVVVNFSLIENTAGATFTGANNITGVDPALGPLANNGGPTATHLPALTSPVINAGDPAFVPPPSTDQRGFARVAGGRIDMGSVESDGGTIQLSSATASVSEGGGSITITITRTGNTDPAFVNYATSNGSAAAPGDYTATSGTANFAAGVTTASFLVPIVDDAVFEGNETFNITLSNPSVSAILGAQATEVVTIVENDPAPADLAITKIVSGGAFFAGQPMTFNIAVSNAGPNPAGAVVVTDILPAGATLVSAAPSQGSCSGTTTVTCSLGALGNGGSATIALSVTPAAAGPLSNTASVSAAPQPDPNPANNAATAAVTVQPASAVPLFGSLAKILLAFTSAMTGLFMLKKRSN